MSVKLVNKEQRQNMERKGPVKSIGFWLSLLIVLATIILAILAFYHRLDFINYQFPGGETHHWFSWIGVAYIAAYTPAFYYLKRRYRKSYQSLIQVHVSGNLVAFTLISIHFGHHVSEFFTIIPHPGTGLPLFTAIILLVSTGILMRFQIVRKQIKTMRTLHTSMMLAFYLIIIFHILRGLEVM